MAYFVSCPCGEKQKMHNSEFQVILITHKKVSCQEIFAPLAGEVPVTISPFFVMQSLRTIGSQVRDIANSWKEVYYLIDNETRGDKVNNYLVMN